MPEAMGTMSELCKGMEWPVHFSTLMLCAMNGWSPSNPIDDLSNAELETNKAQSSPGCNDIDLNITLPLKPTEDLSKFFTEINKLEEFQKQVAQSYEVQSLTLLLSIVRTDPSSLQHITHSPVFIEHALIIQ